MARLVLNLLMVLGLASVVTGCASKKYVSQQINPVQSQVAVLTEEMAKLDESLQDMRGGQASRSASQPSYGASARSHGGASASGGVYRTPSGFELPSLDIQKALKNAGYYKGSIDGKIGPATESSIQAFQQDNGLNADGICGQMTWQKLKGFLSTGK